MFPTCPEGLTHIYLQYAFQLWGRPHNYISFLSRPRWQAMWSLWERTQNAATAEMRVSFIQEVVYKLNVLTETKDNLYWEAKKTDQKP